MDDDEFNVCEVLLAESKNSYVGDSVNLEKTIGFVYKPVGSITVIVGEKQSGKTALVNSFNFWLSSASEPKIKSSIVELDIDLTISQSMSRGAFEESLLDAICQCKREQSILLIDNIHYAVNAYNEAGIMPILSRGADVGVSVICTTTPDSYRAIFDKRGYKGVVNRLNMSEPNVNDLVGIFTKIGNKLSDESEVYFKKEVFEELSYLAKVHMKTNAMSKGTDVLARSIALSDGLLVQPELMHRALAEAKGVELNIIKSKSS